MQDSNEQLEKQVKDLTAQLEEKKAEVSHFEKEMKLVRIEYTKQVHENEDTVRRYRKMIEDEKVFAITKFAKDLIEVRDNLRFCLENIDASKIDTEADIDAIRNLFKATFEGQRLTAETMDHCLKRFNIVQYDPKGEKFDPSMHEAVFTVDEPDREVGTVAVVMQTGFKIGDRILRAAKVGIVKR